MACRRAAALQWLNPPSKLLPRQHVRHLSLHEYQSQNILKEYNIPVARGTVATTPSEVREFAEQLGGPCVIKSQVLKGGRGKGTFDNGLAGGIQSAQTPDRAKEFASQMLGHRLRTKQTGASGLQVNKVLVVEPVKFTEEWYLAITIDREKFTPTIVISRSGGVNIEAAAKAKRDVLHSFPFSLSQGITANVLADISAALGLAPDQHTQLGDILKNLYRVFRDKDGTLLEINPLAWTDKKAFVALDAKFTFDNAAEKRQSELFALRDPGHEVAEEVEAEKSGLVYVRMEGTIGNVVNGAGLAMATNDAIGMHGGSSANFLDAGGQATKETMQQAFKIIMDDERVKTILVNIYGGIISCAMIAESIIGAAKDLGPMRVPVVVRLQGTDSAKGLKMVEEANLGLHVVSDFGEAAKMAVALAKA